MFRRVSVLVACAFAACDGAQAQSVSAPGALNAHGPLQQGQPTMAQQPAQPPGSSSGPVNVYVVNPSIGHETTPLVRDETGGMKPLPDIPRAVFEAAQGTALPMSPPEIEAFRRNVDATKRSSSEPLKPLRPATCSATVDLSPGAVPPVVRAANGYGTTVTFSDGTGAPWPIKGIDGFAEKEFRVAFAAGDERPTSFQIRPGVVYGSGNVAVMLDGLATPVLLSVEIGYAREVDYRCDLKIPVRGPLAAPDPAPAPIPAQIPQYLIDILHGVPPSFAKPLVMQGGVGRAWLVHDKLVVRTTMVLLSPIPIARIPSQDGTYVYELDYTPVVLASNDGRDAQIMISE